MNEEELKAKEAELKEREGELTKKEENLNERETTLAKREADTGTIAATIKEEYEKKLQTQREEYEERLKQRNEVIKQLAADGGKVDDETPFTELNKRRNMQKAA